MTHDRIFQSGNSQAVRLSKGFRFSADRVEVFWRGDEVVREIPPSAAAIVDRLASLPENFMDEGRDDQPPQEREGF